MVMVCGLIKFRTGIYKTSALEVFANALKCVSEAELHIESTMHKWLEEGDIDRIDLNLFNVTPCLRIC